MKQVIIFFVLLSTNTFLYGCNNNYNLKQTEKTLRKDITKTHLELMSSLLFRDCDCVSNNRGGLQCRNSKNYNLIPKPQTSPFGYWLFTSDKNDLQLSNELSICDTQLDPTTGTMTRGNKEDLSHFEKEDIILKGLLELNSDNSGKILLTSQNNRPISLEDLKISKSRQITWEIEDALKQRTSAFYDPSIDILYGQTKFKGGLYNWRATRLSSRVYRKLSLPHINPLLIDKQICN